jgi:copper transport protein
MRLSLLVALAAALAAPATAGAHASIKGSDPGSRQRLEQAPADVRVRFDQVVTPLADSVVVLATDGRVVSGVPRSAESGQAVAAATQGIPRGAYTVRWRALSSDGHVVSGVFTFGVGVEAPPPTEAVGASGPSNAEDAVRWLLLVAASLLCGALCVLAFLGGEALPAAAERRLHRLAIGAGALVLELLIAAFVLRAKGVLQLPFGDLLYGDLSPIAANTRFGQAFVAMTLGYALTTALAVLAWLTRRRRVAALALAAALAFASGFSLSGHQAPEGGTAWHAVLADWLHLVAALLWLGGLVALAVAWPSLAGYRRDALLGFSRLAAVLVALLVGAGIYLAVLRLPDAGDLVTTGYGRVLSLKIALVLGALGWGLVHRTVADRWARGEAGAGVLGLLRRSLLGEGIVVAAVLLVAAVLVNSDPPEPAPRAPASASAPLPPPAR